MLKEGLECHSFHSLRIGKRLALAKCLSTNFELIIHFPEITPLNFDESSKDNLIADLTHQNKLLKKENDMMRSLLRQYQSVETDDHCPSSPGILRSISSPATAQSIRIDQGGFGKPSKSDFKSDNAEGKC